MLYFKDFNSGTIIENIVTRAKKMAIKEFLDTGQKDVRVMAKAAAKAAAVGADADPDVVPVAGAGVVRLRGRAQGLQNLQWQGLLTW